MSDHETIELTTSRLLVGICSWPKDDPRRADDREGHFELGSAVLRGRRQAVVLIDPDTAAQRDRAEALKAELMPRPWPRMGSRARLRITVQTLERIVEALGWQLSERERLVLDNLRAVARVA